MFSLRSELKKISIYSYLVKSKLYIYFRKMWAQDNVKNTDPKFALMPWKQ